MSCNSGIGFLGDNIKGVLKAVNYLTNNNQLKILNTNIYKIITL